jgi:NAD(P)-dependent dehydrogenase (short-subunit alcohol dehydrogenase family)
MNSKFQRATMATERTALITGASSGFGLLTTVTLARHGWRVIATMRDLTRREGLEAAARAAGVLDRIEFLALDVTDNEQIAKVAAEIAARTDGGKVAQLDALVSNAGFAVGGFAEDVSDAELRKQFDTNFFGATAVVRAFLPQFRRQGAGHIVMTSSISGRMGFPGVSSYVASKFAVEGWAETLRLEMKPLGIQVALVEPGSFETNIWSSGAMMAKQSLDPHSPNAARVQKLMGRMKDGKPKADPQIVADGIAAILENPRPKLRYVFGTDARMGLLLKRLLPASAVERLLINASGIDG